MAFIKSRKHALALRTPDAPLPASHHPLRIAGSALASAASLALPLAVHGQGATPATPPAANTTTAPGEGSQLPTVRARASVVNDYKADVPSSPKFTQPLVDTPQTITVIKKEILQQQAATSLAEAMRNTPGITLQLGENGNTTTGDSLFMRGFDTTNSIFVDGIRDLGAISRDVFNIEQIEVVKGPSGSDNGRGASSGYVNLVSKVADLDSFSNASVSIGTDSRVRATADVNRPFDIDTPGGALRLNLMAQDYGVPGRDEVKLKRYGFAPSVAFGLEGPTRIYLNYLYMAQRDRPDGGVSTFGLPGYVYGDVQGPKVDSENYYGSRDDFNDVTLHMFTARIEHKLTPVSTLRNTTRLGHTEQDYLLTGVNAVSADEEDPDTLIVARTRQGRHQTNEILTNQTNLSTTFNTGAVKHDLSTGFELIYERQHQANRRTLNNTSLPEEFHQPEADLYNPDIHDTFLTPPDTGAYTKGSTLSAAVYAFDTLTLSESWLLNGGLRWERFHTETNSATYTNPTEPAPGLLTQNPPLSLTDTLLSWKVGVVFKPAKEGSVYATMSNSYQPPGGANLTLNTTNTNQAFPSLKPQEGRNIELGTKWDLLGGRLAATAAIYRAENKNELVSDGATSPTFTQVGKRRVDGVELGVVGQVTSALDLSAGFSYMDSEILRGVPQGTNANQGSVIIFTPKIAFSSWATYKLPYGLTVGGGARYIDKVARSSNVTITSNLPGTESYWVADAMMSYEINKNLALQLNVNNLFDKEYVASVNSGGSRYIPGEARNALLTANFTY